MELHEKFSPSQLPLEGVENIAVKPDHRRFFRCGSERTAAQGFLDLNHPAQ